MVVAVTLPGMSRAGYVRPGEIQRVSYASDGSAPSYPTLPWAALADRSRVVILQRVGPEAEARGEGRCYSVATTVRPSRAAASIIRSSRETISNEAGVVSEAVSAAAS